MKRHFQNIKPFLIILPVFLWAACNPAKRLTEGEYLLDKTIITKIPGIEKTEIESYIKQKPNRKILGVARFHLAIHNIVDEEKVKRKRIKLDKKIENKNAKRVAKGKKTKSKEGFIFGEWLLNIGEAPVILDSTLTEKSAKQINLFLNNKGYFNSSITDSVSFHRNKKAIVYYIIDAHQPYTVRNVDYVVEDSSMAYFVLRDTSGSHIKKGRNYDVDAIQSERERITRSMRDNGYYFFSKEYIYFKVDSSLNSDQVDITIAIKKFVLGTSTISDSVIETKHTRYYINNVFIQTDFNSINPGEPSRDTLLVDGYYFVFNSKLQYKPKVVLEALLMQKESLYSESDAEGTYRRLSELKSFKLIDIGFREISSNKEQLDCYIRLSPVLKQAFSVETEGTNTSGNLGIAGSLVYQNKNVLRGAEIIEIKLKGALEAQKQINESVDNNTKGSPFNIIEFGPEASLNVPRPLFPFNLFDFSKNASPKTIFTSAVNYQKRPDYTRSIAKLSFGLNYKETIFKRHIIIPLEINLVKVDLKPDFADALYKKNNIVLLNSYSDHLVSSSRWSYTINTQDINKRTNFYYLKINAESSGNILRGVSNLLHSPKDESGIGSYRILNIRYSQYLRLDVDYRFYRMLNRQDKLVFRVASGVGKPLHNLRVLPFEKGFFAGGSNGIRAWTARSLGPGSYSNISALSFDQIGDAQLEGNIEYRFNLFKMLNGALFVDVGNIWLRKADPNRPGGEFKLDTFYKEIAIGTGIGARVDFNFFVVRLDMGLKVRDPMFGESGRWVIAHINDREWKNNFYNFHNEKYPFLNLNLGIGYPF